MPTANADAYTTPVGQPIEFDVTDNDEGEGLALVALTQPIHGALEVLDATRLRYTPKADFSGLDGFTYTVKDQLDRFASAPVRIAVGDANNPPTATSDVARVSGGETSRIAVLENDWDPDGDALLLAAVNSPSHGSITISPDQSINYSPAAGYSGADSFEYTVTDGRGAFVTARVDVEVTSANTPPTTAMDEVEAMAGQPVEIDVLANDADADSDPLTILTVGRAQQGSVEATADQTRLVYTADANAQGSDRFDYTASDSRGGESRGEVVVSVLADNTDPIAIADETSVAPGQSVTINPLANDSDPDGDGISLISVGLPSAGSVRVNSDQSITYTAPAGFNGVEELRYSIGDGRGGVASATIRINVSSANLPPSAIDDAYRMAIDSEIVIDPRENDQDPNGDVLVVTSVTTPANGDAQVTDSGTRVRYVPNAGFSGTDTFTYFVSDTQGGISSATVTITVAAQSAPTAVDDLAATQTGQPVRIAVLANDGDPDGDPISLVSVDQPTNGGVDVGEDDIVTYTPNAGFEGSDSFGYRIRDALGAEDTATVTVVVGGTNGEAFADGTFWTDGTGWI